MKHNWSVEAGQDWVAVARIQAPFAFTTAHICIGPMESICENIVLNYNLQLCVMFGSEDMNKINNIVNIVVPIIIIIIIVVMMRMMMMMMMEE